ncbi:MAG: PIG-L family deacetylase [Planctomycetota bacterium]
MGTARRAVMAIGAHPDDIEFMMAGTLVLLGRAGYELHYMNVANGSCGTATRSVKSIVRLRAAEARAAARSIGAAFHPPLVNDMEVFYEKKTLARLGAVIRAVDPAILLIPSPEDYMEDHVNTARLAVSAAFCRGMRNFPTRPACRPVTGEVAVYHALPYGLSDGMRRPVRPDLFVDVSGILAVKRAMLALHRSQKEWLDVSQGLDSYLATMEQMTRAVGRMSRRFRFAEGWRRHSHLGFSAEDADPLAEALGRKVGSEGREVRWSHSRTGRKVDVAAARRYRF